MKYFKIWIVVIFTIIACGLIAGLGNIIIKYFEVEMNTIFGFVVFTIQVITTLVPVFILIDKWRPD